MKSSGWFQSRRSFFREVRKPLNRGFSLIELLVGLLILAVLMGLGLSALGGVREKSDRTRAGSNLRQIGLALYQFTADHDGLLPGPLWPGQIPVPDPDSTGRLSRVLASYLEIEPGTAPVNLFIPPAYRRASSASLANARTYVLNMAVATPEGSGTSINPWGSLVTQTESETESDNNSPLPLAAVPATAWAISDADQQHPRVLAASWKSNTPAHPIHGPLRMALLFSGAVDFFDTEALQIPE